MAAGGRSAARVEVHVRDRGDLAKVAQALTAIGNSQAQIDESTHRATVVVEAAPSSSTER